jgi:hypothetical protein
VPLAPKIMVLITSILVVSYRRNIEFVPSQGSELAISDNSWTILVILVYGGDAAEEPT